MYLNKIVYEKEKKSWKMEKENMDKKIIKNTRILLLETAVKIFLFMP